EPGKYLLRIENFYPSEKKVFSVGETVITLKQPTPEEARGVYERMKKAPREAYDGNRMTFLGDAADFETMYHPVYLPILREFAEKGDLDALPSLERAECLEANQTLIDLMISAMEKDRLPLAYECYLRLKPCIPFPNWYNDGSEEYSKRD